MLTGAAATLGVVGGGAAWALLHLIDLLTSILVFHQWGIHPPPMSELEPDGWLIVSAVGAAVVISLLAKLAPIIRGHGIPEAMESVLTNQSRVTPRAAILKPVSAALAIGSGAPFGAEGPIIVTGGSLGSLLGQVLRVSPSERKILLGCGAAAGMSAVFGTPLAAVVLVIQLLVFEFSRRVFLPLAVAAAVAGGMHAALFGSGPLFQISTDEFAGLRPLPLFIVLGLACGLLAVLITRGLFFVEGCYRKLPVSDFWHPIVGAVGFATIGLIEPRTLGVGYDMISDLLNDRLTIATIAVLGTLKLFSWWLALGSGTSGGTLAPILIISASMGLLYGHLVTAIFPGIELSPGAFGLVAMAATFGAAAAATFAAIVFVFELTRDYEVILPLMVASVVADLTASSLLPDSIMTEKLTRRGVKVSGEYSMNHLQTTPVAEVMSREVVTVGDDATVDDGQHLFATNMHSDYPIIDTTGACVGIVSRGDLLTLDAAGSDLLIDHAARRLVTIEPGDSSLAAMDEMVNQQVDHLPVVANGDLVGIITRTDIFKVRRHQLDAEEPQPGLARPHRGYLRRANNP